MLTPFSNDEISDIASSLEDYHAVFYVFWEMANVFYDDSIKTAAVQFHPERKPDMLVSKEFWDNLTFREKLFVVCHECMHVLLLHNIRNGKEITGATFRLVNIAQDICINEMIVTLFGFNRNDIRDWKRYCWIDTCFKDPSKVLRNQTFDYYLNLLIQEQKDDLPELFDEHGFGSGEGSDGNSEPIPQEIKDKMQEIAGKLAEELTQSEIEAMINSMGDDAGDLPGGFEIVIDRRQRPAKVNFNKIVKHLKRSRMKEKIVEHESFVFEDRRFSDIIRRSNVILPGKHDRVKPSKDRLLTALYMDISGSCIEFYQKFLKIYAAFDAQKETFEIRSFAFDVRVMEIAPGQKVSMGGGTRFDIIERQNQQLKAEYGKYPDCVLVVTDGDGNEFTPEIENRWVWILVENPVYRYIPVKSRKYHISDITF